eukprot:4138609-Amphidinium_carterae.1
MTARQQRASSGPSYCLVYTYMAEVDGCYVGSCEGRGSNVCVAPITALGKMMQSWQTIGHWASLHEVEWEGGHWKAALSLYSLLHNTP